MNKKHICNLVGITFQCPRKPGTLTHSHLYQRLTHSSRKSRDHLSDDYLPKGIKLRLPNSHCESNDGADDVDRSAPILQSEGNEKYAPHRQTGTVRGESDVEIAGENILFSKDKGVLYLDRDLMQRTPRTQRMLQ